MILGNYMVVYVPAPYSIYQHIYKLSRSLCVDGEVFYSILVSTTVCGLFLAVIDAVNELTGG